MSRLLAVVVVALALAAAAGSAGARPPITCGRVGQYVVKSHVASCAFAIKSLRAYMARRAQPPRYRCRRYSGDVPAYCLGQGRYGQRYFFAGRP